MKAVRPTSPTLAMRSVHVVYPDGARAARDIHLEVARGEVVALAGESGCGKTTIARAILGLLPLGSQVTGSIRIGDTEVVGASRRILRRLRGRVVGYVAQDPYAACDPLQRVGSHVAEAWHAHDDTPPAGEVARRLGALGIADPARAARRYPHEWSGGMLQRATIAAASAHDPPLVIADEPTTALDAELADDTLQVLRSTGAAILLVSHDLGLVRSHADQVAVCYAGEIVEVGATDRVLDRPRHPYTRALLDALPRPGHGLPTPLPGTPPSPHADHAGCPFAARCPERWEACDRTRPVPVDGVRCLLGAEGAVQAQRGSS